MLAARPLDRRLPEIAVGSWSPAEQGPGLSSWDALAVLVVQHPGRAHVVVSGELDIATAPQLAEVLEPLVDALTAELDRHPLTAPVPPDGGPVGLVVDLRDVGVLCAAGIDLLVAAHDRLAARGGRLQVVGARPLAVRCLRLLGLHGLLP